MIFPSCIELSRRFVVVAAAAALLSACTALGTTGSLALKTAFQLALGKAIERAEQPSERADRIIQGVDELLVYLQGDEEVTLEAMAGYAREVFNYEQRPLSEKILIDDLIQVVQISLQEAFDQTQLDEKTEVRLTEILTRTKAVAELYASRSSAS